MKKTDIPKCASITVEYGSPFGYKSETVTLVDIKDVSPSYVDKPLEITGNDGNGNLYRLYLDKNKLELANDENGNFVGCIGSIFNITA